MNTTGTIRKTQKVELEGRGEITLRPADHLATGGEGSVYKASSATLVKIYTDPQSLSRDDLKGKIQLLKKIKHPYVVSPQGLVLQNHKPIGFYMSYEKGEPLARVCTTAYRQRENFGDRDALTLVDRMKKTVEVAHQSKAILVDANEFNWLVSRVTPEPEPRIIDVDSWAIGKWPAKVIMPSIRDWHTQGFSEGSDWFSFAVVSFQVLTGIHPYKGNLPGYTPQDMEKRMKEKKSVFSPGIRLNSAVRDFNCIPDQLLEWYKAVFEESERSQPPSPFAKTQKAPHAAIIRRVIGSAGQALVLDLLYQAVNDFPVRIFPCGVVRLRSGALIDLSRKRVLVSHTNDSCEVIEIERGFLVAEIASTGSLSARLIGVDGSVSELSSSVTGERLFRSGNRLFIVNAEGLVELSVLQLSKPLLVTGTLWPVMVNSVQWYEDLGIQDSLGAAYLIVPFAEKALSYIRTAELDGKKIVAAKAGNRFVSLTALNQKSGGYENFRFVFDSAHTRYQVSKSDVLTGDLNLACLPKGVVAEITDDEKLLITVPVNGQEKIVSDGRIDSSWLLGNWADRVVYSNGRQVWSMKLA